MPSTTLASLSMPVSYTHLDVYKRQGEWWTRSRSLEETKQCVLGSQICIGITSEADNLVGFVRVLTDFTFKALIFDVIVAPVSYTHLDVYKRQALADADPAVRVHGDLGADAAGRLLRLDHPEAGGAAADPAAIAGRTAVSYTHLDVYKRQGLIYARIHQEGGVIKPVNGQALKFWWVSGGFTNFVVARSVTIPRRRYMGLSADNQNEIVEATEDWYSRLVQ